MSAISEEYIYEPREFSDLLIIYDNARFHVHKYVLARYSEYFSAMLKGDPTVKEIQLPLVHVFKDFDAQTYHHFNEWLLAVYDDEIVTVNDFIAIRTVKDSPSAKKPWGVLMEFTQYFGCKKLSDQLKDATRKMSSMNLLNNSQLFSLLSRVEGVKWTDIADELIDRIGKNFRVIISAPDYNRRCWNEISTATQDRIVTLARKHNQLDANFPSNIKMVQF